MEVVFNYPIGQEREIDISSSISNALASAL